MEKLSKEEQKFKRYYKRSIEKIREYNWDWWLKIKKYDSGGYSFTLWNVTRTGGGYFEPFLTFGECQSEIWSEVDDRDYRPKLVTKECIKGLLDQLNQRLEYEKRLIEDEKAEEYDHN